MPKARFTSLDLRCVVRDIQSKLVGLRVANVYDLNSKTYMLKLAKPDSKVFLVIESGVRIHSTGFSRETKDVPSVFSLKVRRGTFLSKAKGPSFLHPFSRLLLSLHPPLVLTLSLNTQLRKAIRAKRLENIVQYGFDRVIDMTFGSGEVAHHLICEFYAGGNIVLTDADYKILALLRTYKADDGSMNVSLGETYPTAPQQTLKLPTSETLDEAIKSANVNTAIRDVMAKHFVIGTEMIDHCLASCGIDGRAKAPTYLPEWTSRLIASFKDTLEFAESPNSHPGFVVFQTTADRAAAEKTKPAKKKKGDKSEAAAPSAAPAPAVAQPIALNPANSEVVTLASVADRTDIFYDNFVPSRFLQYSNLRFIEFADFDSAVDEYFSKVEGQKVEAQRIEHEQSFVKRVDKVREDNQKRVQTLVDAEDKARKMAVLIEQNAELVDAVVKVVNGYIARQIDWTELAELVKQEKKKGNPLASVIHKLKLDQNSIVVLLYTPDDKFDEDDYEEEEEEEDEEDDDEEEEGFEKVQKADIRESKEATAIELDLSLSAYKNSEKYYTVKKKATDKKDKTIEAANTAIKRAERKARSELKEVKLKASILKLRSPYWFEKFNWFITSEGFIVVSGRDMQQNEQLYKRYLAKGDAYIHADVHGASTCIVKNPTGQPIPPRTLTEAGALSVCHSAAWKNRIVTSAYWVEENQVSKTAPSGEYLSTGSFMIRGKKNFLPPANLVMGFGILFRLADESIAAHMKETTDDDIRREKDRKNQERDLIDQLKHAEDFIATDAQSEQFVELGEGESDGEEDESTTETQAAEDGDHDQKPSEEAAEDEEEEEEEDEDDDGEKAPSAATDSKFEIDLAQQGDLEEDESALLAEAEEGVSGLSVDTDASSSAAGADSKKKLTKHERARLKKAEARGVEVDQLARGPKPAKKDITNKQEKLQQQQQAAKKKKIPKKYQHQDEDERRAAMELLGSAGKAKNQPAATTSAPAAAAKKGGKAPQQEKTVEEVKEKAEARKKAQAAQLIKDREEEEIRQLMKDEKLEQLNENDLEKLRETSAKGLGVNLSALTGRPQSTDVLLYAMTICAPYDALGDYKYKIKITPGTFKKGKSSKLAINAFLHQPEATERERELIRSIPENELSMTMISNAKLQMPGLLAANKKK